MSVFMNTKQKGWIAIVLFLVLFGGGWFLNKGNDWNDQRQGVMVQDLTEDRSFLPREYVKIKSRSK